MTKQTDLAATFLLPGTSMTVNRVGYGRNATRWSGGVGTTA